MYKRKRYNAKPLPEILDGKDWEVRNSGDIHKAYVDFKKRQFVVPYDESPAGEIVRAHEAMHIKITPRDFNEKRLQESTPEIEWVTVQSLEDARVHQGMRLCGIPTHYKDSQVWTDKELDKLYSECDKLHHPQRLAEALFAVKNCAEEEKTVELTKKYDQTGKVLEIVDKVYEKYYASHERNGELTSFEEMMEACRELRIEIQEIESSPPPPMPSPGDGEGDTVKNLTGTFVPGSDGTTEPIRGFTQEEMEEIGDYFTDELAQSAAQTEFSYRDEYSEPGKLRPIQHPKLDKTMKFKLTDSVKQTPSDEGVIPTRMHRYTTDMRLFNRKGRRRAGAAVLIDVSGSMSLSHDEVLNILKQCPAAIVACYSGFTYDGILRIIAENGRYSSDLHKGMPGSNIVDVPALHWLASRKEGKKLWISDGWITMCNEGMGTAETLRKLNNLMRAKNIERVGNVRELLKSGKLIDRAWDDGHTIGRSYKK